MKGGRTGGAAKAALIILEIAGLLIAVAAGLLVFLFWRVQSGPVSLALFRHSAEFAIERALPAGHDAAIGAASLKRGAVRGAYEITLDRVNIDGPNAARVAALSRVELGFSVSDILAGSIGPERIVLVDPSIHIVRDENRRFILDYAPDARTEAIEDRQRRNVFRLLTGGQYFRGAFKSAELRGADIRFFDTASGRSWVADGAEATIQRHGGGYAANIEGVFDIDGKPAAMSLDAGFDEASGRITADLDVDQAPVGDILQMLYGPRAAIISAPLTGKASITLTRSGEVVASRIDGRAGAGQIRIGRRMFAVGFIDVAAAFDPKSDRFDLNRLAFDIGGTTAELAGVISLDFAGDVRAPATVGANLIGSNIVIAADGLFEQPLAIPRLAISAAYDVVERRLTISDATADLLGVTIAGSGSYASASTTKEGVALSAGATASLAIEGELDPERIRLGWPVNLGVGARDFIATQLPTARVSNVRLHLDLPAGALQPGAPMPDEAMALEFDIDGATAIYAPTMTPLTRASGSARLTGNRFLIDVEGGRVGRVRVSDGKIDFTALAPKGAPVHYGFTAAGDTRDILEILNQEPLTVLKTTPFTPDRFSGTAQARVVITRPNLRDVPQEDYQYSGRATFSDVTVSEFFRGVDLAGASGGLDLASRAMTVKADATIGGAPVEIDWVQRFFEEDGRSQFKVAGTVDSATGDVFGVPTRRILRGPAPFTLDAVGDFGSLESLSLSANFTGAELALDAIGWTKPEGAAASGALNVAFVAGGGVEVRSLALVGAGVDVSGSASFAGDGSIVAASFPRAMFEGAADLSFSLQRTAAGGLDAALTGAYLNAGPTVQAIVEAGAQEAPAESDPGPDLLLRGRIDTLDLRGGARFTDASLDFARTDDAIQALSFSARTAAGAPLSMVLSETGAESGPAQAVEARTDDIGSLITALFGVSSVRGGQGSLQILIDEGEAREPGLAGRLAARDIRVVGAPLLARVLSAGSLTGLADLLTDEGIALERAAGDFSFRGGVLTVKDARASGPSVGITAQGSIAAAGDGGVDLHGAIAPVYAVNSILGAAPLIGDMFVSREGEGVLALSYDVTGDVAAPTVSVNPLSALAPGFFRRIFEVDRPQPEAAATPPAE